MVSFNFFKLFALGVLIFNVVRSQTATTISDIPTTSDSPNTTALLITNETDTTSAGISTTTTSTVPSITEPNVGSASTIPLNTDIGPCTCDIIQNRCDTNCCCDTECSGEDRLTFSGCAEISTQNYVNKNLCQYEVTVFKNNTPATETVKNSNIFCIYKDGYVGRSYFTPVDLVTDSAQYDEYVNDQSSFNYKYQYAPPQYTDTQARYKSGQLLVAYKSPGDQTSILAVPARAGMSSNCVDRNPAIFLQDQSGSCTREIGSSLGSVCETSNEMLDSYSKSALLRTQKIFMKPNANLTSLLTIDILGTVQTSTYDNVTCYGVIKKVEYTITHKNGVLTKAEAFFTLTDLPGSVTSFEQEYSIKFVELNAPTEVFHRSGNPGYVIGQPVLAGKRINDYIALNGDRNQYLTMVTATADGDCVTDSLERKPIVFGENFRSGCMLKLTTNSLSESERCEIIKSQIIEALLGPTRTLEIDDNTDIYIASFGNSNPLKVGDWIKVIKSNQITSEACTGIALHLQILYASVGALDNPQSMIVGAKLELEPIYVEFQCVGAYCQLQNNDRTQNFEMVTSVAFIDVTQPPEAAVAEKPVTSTKLPANFFHPYYITNDSVGTSLNYMILLTSLISLVLIA